MFTTEEKTTHQSNGDSADLLKITENKDQTTFNHLPDSTENEEIKDGPKETSNPMYRTFY